MSRIGFRSVKLRIALAISLALAAFTGCELYQAINVTWTIDSWSQIGSSTRVNDTFQNLGRIDLTGVNLEIGVDTLGNGTYPVSAWTADFGLSGTSRGQHAWPGTKTDPCLPRRDPQRR